MFIDFNGTIAMSKYSIAGWFQWYHSNEQVQHCTFYTKDGSLYEAKGTNCCTA